MKYGYTKQIDLPFTEAVAKVKEALAEKGFGVLTEIDVKTTMKKKLDVDYDNYVILGACNPHLAHRALQSEKEIGLLLPCNVIVYENNGTVYASAIVPSVALGVVANDSLNGIAQEAEEGLLGAIDSVA